jgi:hypothetical protein
MDKVVVTSGQYLIVPIMSDRIERKVIVPDILRYMEDNYGKYWRDWYYVAQVIKTTTRRN